jgi:hypothetical protein
VTTVHTVATFVIRSPSVFAFVSHASDTALPHTVAFTALQPIPQPTTSPTSLDFRAAHTNRVAAIAATGVDQRARSFARSGVRDTGHLVAHPSSTAEIFSHRVQLEHHPHTSQFSLILGHRQMTAHAAPVDLVELVV